MSPPPDLRADRLWRRLAQAQDDAVARGAPAMAAVTRAPRPRWRPRTRRMGAALLFFGGAAVAAIALLAHRSPSPSSPSSPPSRVGAVALAVPTVPTVPTRAAGPSGRTLVADARSDLPLQFADGSNLTFRAGSTGRMQRVGDDGADVFLEQGRLEAHVIHARDTLWMVHAGPYRVRVTGTRFAVTWVAARLDVALFEGSVVIDGAELGAGVPLRAGQQLTVDRGVVRTDVLAVASPEAGGAPVTGLAAALSAAAPAATAAPVAEGHGADDVALPRSRVGDEGDWFLLAKQSAYAEAFSAAMRAGWKRLCHRLDAHRLLTLADVARYAGARARARQAFEALVTRFPRNPLAADAVFSLGRLAFESDQSDRAARWFRRYVDDWPHGPLADQAVGRLVECAIHMHDSDAARGAARAYLARAPGGPHARLARQILRDGVGGPTASVAPGLSPRGSP